MPEESFDNEYEKQLHDLREAIQDYSDCAIGTHTIANQLIEPARNFMKAVKSADEALKRRKSTLESRHKGLSLAIDSVLEQLSQGEAYKNHEWAFRRAKEMVVEWVRDTPDLRLDVNVLAVASSYSWDFLTHDLPSILADNDQFHCKVRLLLVAPDYLREMNTGYNGKKKGKELWENLSRGRAQQGAEILDSLPKRVRRRFDFQLAWYRNLPHWHGVVLGPSEERWRRLFMGRTDWVGIPNGEDASRSKPELRVGENKYRLFSSNGDEEPGHEGRERVDLFQNWFHYYSLYSEIALR